MYIYKSVSVLPLNMSFVDGEPLEEEKLAAETTAQLQVCGRKGRNGEFIEFYWDFIGILFGILLVCYWGFIEISWDFIGVFLAILWCFIGISMGIYWDFVGILWDVIGWDCIWILLGFY